MKTVLLLRYAKAVSRRSKKSDFKRPLTKGGANDTKIIAKVAKKTIDKPDLILTSPAYRALETAKIYAKTVGYKSKEIVTNEEIYEAAGEGILKILQGLDDQLNSVLVVGHNPAFEDLAKSLSRQFSEEMPKSSLLGLEFDIKQWCDLKQGQGKVSCFDYPGREAKERKQFRASTEEKLTQAIWDVLKASNSTTWEPVQKSVQKASKKIAKEFADIIMKNEVVTPFGKTQMNPGLSGASGKKVVSKKQSPQGSQQKNPKASTKSRGK